MAKLPDATALGRSPIGPSGRPISSYDVTGYARGAAALAQGTKDVGAGLSQAGNAVAAYAVDEKNKRDELEIAKAESEYQVRTTRFNSQLGDETDNDGLKEKYNPLYSSARDESAAMISDPRKRELWLAKRAPDVEKNLVGVDSRAFTILKDKEIAGVQGKLSELREAALKETDPIKVQEKVQAAHALLDGLESNGYIDAKTAQSNRQKWAQDYAKAWLEIQPPEERVKMLRPSASLDQVVDRIVGVESGGKPNAKNPNSSATGLGQFVNATWLSTLKEARPDIAQGRSDADLLALRSDPKLSREMVAVLAQKNGAALTAAGLEASPGNVYLAHFLGSDGAIRVLQAEPGKPISEIVSREAIRANPSILGGKTAGTVAQWASDKMGDPRNRPKLVDIVPADQAMQLYRRAETEVAQKQVVASVARGEELERSILDASAGKGDLPDRAAIENDSTLTEPNRNTLLRMYDKAAGDVATWQATWAKFTNPNGGAFNPYDADERKSVDTLYGHLGGTPAALQAVVDRTNILPKTAAVALRGDLVSNDPARVASSLTQASNLLAKNQNIFVGVEGKSDLENNAVAFRHYVDDLGMTAENAAKKIINEQSSEYQASVKARLKNEDIDGKIKKELKVDDLAGAFDQVPWVPFTDPKVGFTPETRLAMYGQYAEQVKERYLEHGDWGRAKKEAAGILGKSWGVTRVNGTATVVPYAPDRAPVMAGVENPSEVIATAATKAIQEQAGYMPDRKTLQFIPVPGVTPQAYKSGQPVPYIVKWEDANGNVQISQKHFVIDGKDARAANDVKQAAGAARNTAISMAEREVRDATPAPLRQYGFQ